MDARLQQRVQRYGWDKAASLYEGYWAAQLLPAQDLLMQRASLIRGENVLDVACGTGLVTSRAADAVGPEGSVTATDISEKMVTLLREKVEAQGLRNITALRAEAEHLQLPDEQFHAVLCALGLMYVTDPLASLREMLRVLRPGGRVCAAVWGARNRCGWAEIFPIVESRIRSEVCPLFFQLGGGNALQITMEMAGFVDVHAERLVTTLSYSSAEDACMAAFAGGPVALAYSRFDEETRGEAFREYLESIEPFRVAGGESYQIPGEFVVAWGSRPARVS
jgi:ubiquinone/menaquinone biosynthesis C-methylase UbiE